MIPLFLHLNFAFLFCSWREQKLKLKKSLPSLPRSTLVKSDGIEAFVFVISSGNTKNGTMIVKRVPVGIYEISHDSSRHRQWDQALSSLARSFLLMARA